MLLGIALVEFSRSIHDRARAVFLPEVDRAVAQIDAGWHSTMGHVAMNAGLVFAIISLPLVIVSARKHEPVKRSVVFGLLLTYVFMQFVLV